MAISWKSPIRIKPQGPLWLQGRLLHSEKRLPMAAPILYRSQQGMSADFIILPSYS